MTGRSVVAWCRRQPGSTEEFPFGPFVRVFKVGGRMFAVGPRETDPNQVTLKADPDNALRLRRQYPAVRPGYHANKRHWNTIRLDGSIPRPVVREMLEESYRLVVASLPAAQRREIEVSSTQIARRGFGTGPPQSSAGPRRPRT